MKSFSLKITPGEGQTPAPAATPFQPRSTEAGANTAQQLSFNTLADAWQHCAGWLEERNLCTRDKSQYAINSLTFKQSIVTTTPAPTPSADPALPTLGPSPFDTSLLHELLQLNYLSSFPREAAAKFFRQQRWDFVRTLDRPAITLEEINPLNTLVRELGLVVLNFSKRILTLGHSDPWISHLALRRLTVLQQAGTIPVRANGAVSIPEEVHRSLYLAQLGQGGAEPSL